MSWKDKAKSLSEQGYSGRQIAKMLEKGRTTVLDFLRSEKNSTPKTSSEVIPKILLIDIETAPLVAHLWSMWQDGIGLNQIQSDWYILSFCAKWVGEDKVIYHDQQNKIDKEDDYELLEKLWDLLNTADIVVGHNAKRFDTKKINARLILNGFPKPSHYRVVDTMLIAKAQFGFTSNKLQYLTDNLCETKKSEHKKFPGHSLWVECLADNAEAWEEMKLYNIDDVLSLEELYNVLSSWDSKLPNFDVYVDDVLDMSEWKKDGFYYSNFGKYQIYRNKVTGVQRRSRVNLLSKEKRSQLLSNLA